MPIHRTIRSDAKVDGVGTGSSAAPGLGSARNGEGAGGLAPCMGGPTV
jgi:hypothetical protein